MDGITTHEKLRATVAAGTARIEYRSGWRKKLQTEVLAETLFNSLTWEKKVLEILARPENASRFEEYYRSGVDIYTK